jgi:hypothetical protein
VEPPAALKNYLKRNYSWGLGEAGWYPDFKTTAGLATEFVRKGGAAETDGVIAFDLQFISGLLSLLGPVEVPEYGVTVSAQNVSELSLQLTRDESYRRGEPQKAFLSYLSSAVLNRVFSSPRAQWVNLLEFLARMGRERHLQVSFTDERLDGLAGEYGVDGSLVDSKGDFLLVADTSVNSTKLNLILKPALGLKLEFLAGGGVRSEVTYTMTNPFPDWRLGRDPRLVQALMLDGVYGSYTRVYANENARLLDVSLDGLPAGPEQVDKELGRTVFGRFLPVLPGTTASVSFKFQTDKISTEQAGVNHYLLHIQKEAGTDATPLRIDFALPPGGQLLGIKLDGASLREYPIRTDLQHDRAIEVDYRLVR